MILEIATIIIWTLVLYLLDIVSALQIALKNPSYFRQHEGNKGLVWYYDQYVQSKDRKWLAHMLIFNLTIFFLSIALITIVGYKIFGYPGENMIIIYSVTQAIASTIGIITNLWGYYNCLEEVKK